MQDKLDAIGVGLSSLCLVHCLLMPFLVILVPALAASVIDSEWAHIILIACALPVSLFAFWRGRRCHKLYHPNLLGGAGLALLASALVFPVQEGVETILSVAGALLLAACHLSNQRLISLKIA